jgi:hypothetical protein
VAMTAYIVITPQNSFETNALSAVPFRRDAHSTQAPKAGQSLNIPLESTP